MGKLPIPKEFLLQFEVLRFDAVLEKAKDRSLPQIKPDKDANPAVMQEIIKKRKGYILTIIACFVIVKVIFKEVFNNQVSYNTLFTDIEVDEKTFFYSYGMTLISLLTEFLFAANGLKVHVTTDEEVAKTKGKNKLYDMLLPSLVEVVGEHPRPDTSIGGERYSRFKTEDDKMWKELIMHFNQFLKTVITTTVKTTIDT